MDLKIARMAAPIGAEIRGVDLSKPLHAAQFNSIERVFNEHGVVYFRQQFLSPSQLLDFSCRFGEQELNTFSETHSLI